jgi:hypothetical protein
MSSQSLVWDGKQQQWVERAEIAGGARMHMGQQNSLVLILEGRAI